ncbi:hypothetical protein ACIA8E_39890 [Streptomyces sp. NPDC051664]|uniref:hypothetical protein n=1 Tax=Streptomyces sp. NPDC051664 TaxID=3365668 RepID=UPI00378D9AF4
MVFVRVHAMKGHLSAAQKEELGAKLIQAVADVECLVNNQTHKETSWVQFYEIRVTHTQRAEHSWSVGRADDEQGDVVIAGRGLGDVVEKGVGEGVEVLGFR